MQDGAEQRKLNLKVLNQRGSSDCILDLDNYHIRNPVGFELIQSYYIRLC